MPILKAANFTTEAQSAQVQLLPQLQLVLAQSFPNPISTVAILYHPLLLEPSLALLFIFHPTPGQSISMQLMAYLFLRNTLTSKPNILMDLHCHIYQMDFSVLIELALATVVKTLALSFKLYRI